MAKQTFTTGQVLTASQMTSLQQTAMLGGSSSIKTASYVLVAADAGTSIRVNSTSATTITVNTGLFSDGDIVTIYNNNSGVSTITAGTATVTTSGSLALSQNQGGVLYFTSASAAIFFQFATPASGDIEGVTAGTGISGGGTSGTVTITNSMATAIDAKGDLVAGTGADTFARLAVGANDTVLTAASGEATGLKWAAPAGGGANWSLLNSGGTALTGAQTVTVSGISGKDKIMVFIASASSANAESYILVRVNEDSGASSYASFRTYHTAGATYSAGILEASAETATNGITVARLSSNSSSQASGYVLFSGCNAAGTKVFNFAASATTGGGNGQEGQIGGGYYGNSNTISSISIRSTSGNLDGGTVYVYTSA